jgi:hypothetical protein
MCAVTRIYVLGTVGEDPIAAAYGRTGPIEDVDYTARRKIGMCGGRGAAAKTGVGHGDDLG